MTTYKDAGVDIDAGEETVRRIKPLVRKTFTPGVMADIGAFGGFFELDTSAFKRPVLVSSVDGVGTKLLVATRAGRYDTVGQDLVNHCVNDIAVCGAKPLFFLDYYATGKLDPTHAEALIGGFAKACQENAAALIGGETAEMPDLYRGDEFDVSGTIVGVVERDKVIDGSRVQAGDILIGLPSTGLHTNGYSLARKVLFEHFDINDSPEALGGATIGETLLAVHRSYLKPIQALIEKDLATGFVHVTGGGIPGNTQRIVRGELTFDVDYQAWKRPAIFDLIKEKGSVPEEDMRRTFNLGIGLIALTPDGQRDAAIETLRALGEEPVVIGRVRQSGTKS
jgi:phosphoribosylformylglycinamidine cyclo-ligase